MAVFHILLWAALASYLLWVLFVAYMNIIRVDSLGLLSPAARILGFPVYIVGKSLNIIINYTLLSLLLLDMARELTVTEHLTRLLEDKDTPAWKRTICAWICSQLLDHFDHNGKHCACQESGDDEDEENTAVL